MTLRTRLLFAALIIPVVIMLDQYTKSLVLETEVFNALGCLDGNQYCGKVELSQSFDLTMLWNRGMSFGALQSEGFMRWVLFLVQLVIAGFFFTWLVRSAEKRLVAGALALVVGGAIGNMIDRFRFGAVVDFLDFSGPWFGWTLPAGSGPLAWIDGWFLKDGSLGIGFPWIFNVADAAVSVGAVLLFLDFFVTSRSAGGTGEASGDAVS